MQNSLVLNLDFLHRQIGRGMYLLWIVDGSHEVLFDLRYSAGVYAGDPARVVNTEKQGPAIPVQKGTDGLVHILVQLVPAFLELQVQAFARLNELLYAGFVDHLGSRFERFTV
jgi:hypothetical protein